VNLIFRFLLTVLVAAFGRNLAPMDESVRHMRVWPTDLDVNGHMNNGRYLSLMDLGRIDLIFRAGLGRVMIRHRWKPLVASVSIRYRKALLPFQRYELRTRLLCWDDKWFVIEQRFVRGGMVVSTALVKGLLRGRDGNVPPAEVMHAVGHDGTSPPMPASVAQWLEVERLMNTDHREGRSGTTDRPAGGG
jgi:acyl-CoA thioesterase FadM